MNADEKEALRTRRWAAQLLVHFLRNDDAGIAALWLEVAEEFGMIPTHVFSTALQLVSKHTTASEVETLVSKVQGELLSLTLAMSEEQ